MGGFKIKRTADRNRGGLFVVTAAVGHDSEPGPALFRQVGEQFFDRPAVVHPDHVFRVALQHVPAPEHMRNSVPDDRVIEFPGVVVVFQADAAVVKPLSHPVDDLPFPLRLEHGFEGEHIISFFLQQVGQGPDVFVVERGDSAGCDGDAAGFALHQRLRLHIGDIAQLIGHPLDRQPRLFRHAMVLFGVQHQRHRGFAFAGQFRYLFQRNHGRNTS
ncbi:hypothetical protein SDC9_146345 [bioreactor metagenome]|uniref:Uncharacterized protein n=1 Tax=bioreactor metagenome TaxID=1076179 RepID=A0A645EAS5_9ZZZZ